MSVYKSMGTAGDAHENAMTESFFSDPETELIERRGLESEAQACISAFTGAEGWCNLRLRHRSLCYLSPPEL
jgi:putative transposase